MNKHHLYFLAGSLTVISLVLFIYKAFYLQFPLLPSDVVERWDIEARVHFKATGGPVKISMGIPSSTHRILLLNEQIVSRGFGMAMKREDSGRVITWSRRTSKGEQALYYRGTTELSNSVDENPVVKTAPELGVLALSEPDIAAAQTLVEAARLESADNDTLVMQILQHLTNKTDESASHLLGKTPDHKKIADTATQLLTLAKLPSRIAWGISLMQVQTHALPEPWLQVYYNDYWHSFKPLTGEPGLPRDLVIIGYGKAPLLTVNGASSYGVQWSVRRNQESALSAAEERGRLLNREFIDFSLFNLPLQTQQVYRVLLLIPLGAMLLVVLRNVIGVKTFGTFMPVLIALAFRETQLLWGVALIVILVALGLSVRFYLEHLKLLLVPRLGALLIIVVIMMALVSVVSHQLGLERGLSVALFPMVIISMTIERMSILWEERGAAEAIQQGLGSLLVAVLAYLLMFNTWTEHLLFVFPELLLVLLAITLLLGRYSGYRLFELFRFKALAKGTN